MLTGRKAQAQQIYDELSQIEEVLGDFHNHYSANHLASLATELDGEYIRQVMKQLRLLESYSSEGKKAVHQFTRVKTVDGKHFDRILRGISIKCVDSFFSPSEDLWFEDSRASYQNKRSIDFIHHPGEEIIQLTDRLEPIFLELRNRLEYLSQEIS